MDPSRKVWKSIVLKHASLEFDKHETEVQHQRKTDDLKKLKSTISESYARNKELTSEIRTQSKYFESVKSSISLLKSSEESLAKEKNDLLKQLELQRIKTGEDKKDQDATLLKYQIMWDQLLSGFHEIPLVQKKLNLEVESKKLEIELRDKEMNLRNLHSNIEQFVEINGRRFQITFIKFADAWLSNKKEHLRNKEIQKQSNKRREELEQKTNHSRETQTITSNVMSIHKNTLPTTAVANTMNTINNMMIDLRDISFASLVSNEGESLLKLKELQKELSMDNLLKKHFVTSCESNQENDHVSSKHQNLNESSKIPVLNKMDHKLAAEKCLNSKSHVAAKNLNHFNDIHNSTKPSKIVSPKNSRIPIVTSPASKEKAFLVPENPVSSRTVRINTNSSPQSAQIRPRFAPMVTSTKPPSNFPKPNIVNNPGALKRKLESPSFASPRILQKVSRNENNTINCSSPRKKYNDDEQIKQQNATNFKTNKIESNFKGVKNLKNVEQQKIIRNDKQKIVEDDENNMVVESLNRSGENLNATYTLGEAQGEEPIQCNETEENVEAVDFDSANVPEDETVSKYFHETYADKENAPPQDTVQDVNSTNAGFFEEMPQNQNFSYEEKEFSENVVFSPPHSMQSSSTTQVQDPPGDDIEIFAKESGKVTSSPTSEENAESNDPAPNGFGSLFFKSRPKKGGFSFFS